MKCKSQNLKQVTCQSWFDIHGGMCCNIFELRENIFQYYTTLLKIENVSNYLSTISSKKKRYSSVSALTVFINNIKINRCDVIVSETVIHHCLNEVDVSN